MSSSLLLQECPVCLVGLIWIVFVSMVSVQLLLCRVLPSKLVQYWSQHSCVAVVQLFFSIRFVRVHALHPYSSIDTTAAWKKMRFILSVRSDFHMTDSLFFFFLRYTTDTMGSSVVNVKTDEPNDGSTACLTSQVLGRQIPREYAQNQIVRSGNSCWSSIRVVSMDENKIQPSKDYHGSYSNCIYIYIYVCVCVCVKIVYTQS